VIPIRLAMKISQSMSNRSTKICERGLKVLSKAGQTLSTLVRDFICPPEARIAEVNLYARIFLAVFFESLNAILTPEEINQL